jgi:formylglycine-generating enzyme required for sulfatase activity
MWGVNMKLTPFPIRFYALCMVLTSTACQSKNEVPQGGTAADAAASSAIKKAPAEFLEKARKNLKFVEGGSFQMGDFGHLHSEERLPYSTSANNKPLHKVTLDSFSMSAYKITYEDHDAYAETADVPKVGMDKFTIKRRHPKIAASLVWQEARDYCQWLGKQLNLPMDLPTEAQWEYAARNRGQFWVVATDNGKMELGRNAFSFDERSAYAKQHGLTRLEPSLPQGHFPPNPLGLYDMFTEGHEWMLDWYAPDYYAKSPEKNPTGPITGTEKVLRSSRGGGGDNLIMGDGLSFTRSHRPPEGLIDEELILPAGRGTTSRCVVNRTTPAGP